MEAATFWTAVGAIGTCVGAVVAILALRSARAPHIAPGLSPAPQEPPACQASLEERVRAHPDIQRLLNHGNWTSTAKAAIDELVRGERCRDDSRRKTATWQQVKAVVEHLRAVQR